MAAQEGVKVRRAQESVTIEEFSSPWVPARIKPLSWLAAGPETRLTARPIMNVRNVLFRRKCAAFGAWASYGHDRLWFRKYYRQCCANFADYQILFFNAMSSILYHFFAGSCLYFHWCADIRIVVMLYTWRILFLLVLHMLIASDWSVHLNKFNKSYCT